LIEQNKIPLPENLEPFRESIGKILKSIYTGETLSQKMKDKPLYLIPTRILVRKSFRHFGKRLILKPFMK
jgi:type III restriction enzyme